MTLKIGDKVRFLNDVGGGVITAFIDEKMVEVQTEDGFEIPVLATELLIDAADSFNMDGSESRPVSKPAAPKPEPSKVVLKTEDFRFAAFKGEAIMAIVPENDTLLHVSDLKFYLINDSNYSFQYLLTLNEGSVDELVKIGVLDPNTKVSVKRFSQSNLSKVKSFKLKGNFFKEGLMEHPQSLEKEVSVDGMSFYKGATFSDNDYFNSKAVVFKHEDFDLKEAVEKLSDSEIIKVTKTKETEDKPKKKEKKANPEIEEVDLHIEQIIDNHSEMSNGEIVEVQLGRFETSLETAMRSGVKKIVFIHGVGNGKLKHELRKKLDRKYAHLKYQDASFKEYGYGATMVYLK